MPDPPIAPPAAPQDVFTQEVSPALDEARQILAEVGLRPYRVFLCLDTYSGPYKVLPLVSRVLTELLPPPEVEFGGASGDLSRRAAALLPEGQAVLRGISRAVTR